MSKPSFKDPGISVSELMAMLNYDPLTGIFTWKISRSKKRAGDIAGTQHRKDGYIKIKIHGKEVGASRLAWLWVYGRFPEKYLDHIDRDTSNNSIANLRECTIAENGQNRKAPKNNTSGYVGVYRKEGKWAAKICRNRRLYSLGLHDTAEQAYEAYKAAKAELHVFHSRPVSTPSIDAQPGERIRRMVQLFEGEVKTARWCHKCCEAMALSWTDSGKALEERARIGMTVRDAALALAGGEGE